MLTRKMKDSGIEWIGEIPEDWELKRNKNLYKEINERTETGKEELLSVSEYYGVKPRKSVLKSGETYSRSKNLIGYKMCEKNDLVMNIMLAWKKSLGVTEHNGIVSPAYAVYRPLISDIFPRYFHYLFRTDLYASYFKSFSTGIIDSRLRLYPDKFLSLYSHFPSVDIQNKIVLRLDQKVGNIEKLINESKISIEELKKYKQSLITEAVTKGLDPNVEMKDSGIEWIGEIPSNWDINKMKYVTRVNESKYDFIAGETYIGLENVVSFEGVLNGHGKLATNSRESYFEKGNILYSKLRPYLAKAFIADFSGACSGEFIVFSEFKGNKRYLLYWLISQTFTDFINATSYGTKMPRSSWEYIKETFIPRPTKDVENRIVSYLDEQMARIDKLIEDKTKVIEELEEYKKSLIYEYVTGKKEV